MQPGEEIEELKIKVKSLQRVYILGFLSVPMFYIPMLPKFIEYKLIYVSTKDLLEYIVYFLSFTFALLAFFEKMEYFEKLQKKQDLQLIRKKYSKIKSKIAFWWVVTFVTIILDILCRLLNFSEAVIALENLGVILANLSPLIIIISYIFELDIKRKGYWSLFSFDSLLVKHKNN